MVLNLINTKLRDTDLGETNLLGVRVTDKNWIEKNKKLIGINKIKNKYEMDTIQNYTLLNISYYSIKAKF